MTTLYASSSAPDTLLIETIDDDIEVVISSGEQGPPGSYEMKVNEVSGSGDVVIDYTEGPWQALTLVGDVSTLAVSNWPAAGKAARLILEIVNTGAFRINAWPANTRWVGGPPAVSQGAGKEDLIVLSTGTGGAKIFGSVVGQDFQP